MSTVIDVKASGPELNTFRPTTSIDVLIEGNNNLCNMLSIEVFPPVNILTHQNCSQKLRVYNFSPAPKTIGNGGKIANGSREYVEYDISDDIENVNVVADVDPVEVLCSKITDLSTHELAEARSLLHEFKDVFSVSNNKMLYSSM